MKRILPFLSLFLASCASYHTHHSEGVYEDDGYYASDYDAYYGYGAESSGYSTDGSGVYFNDYNYYPDRWGINYSSSYYSPYRYPRIGFYYRDCLYWTWGCYGFGSFNSWSGYSPWFYGGIAYSSWYFDDYYWYNRWRYRNYNYKHPKYGHRYSARKEATRLANRYSYKQNTRYNSKPNNINRNRVSRDRSRYTAPNRKPTRVITPRNKQPRVKQPFTGGSSNNYSPRPQAVNKPSSSRNELRKEPRLRNQDAWVTRDLNQARANSQTNRQATGQPINRYPSNRGASNHQSQGNVERFNRPNRMAPQKQNPGSHNKPQAVKPRPAKSNNKSRSKSSNNKSHSKSNGRNEKRSRSKNK